MNKNDVVQQVAEKSGNTVEDAKKVIDTVEEKFHSLVTEKLSGQKTDLANVSKEISETVHIDVDKAKSILKSFEETLEDGINKKLQFWKK